MNVFQTIAGQYEPALVTGVNRVVANGIAANAVMLADAMTLSVVALGVAMAFGEIQYRTFVKWAMRAAVISFLLTAAGFNQFIATPAMDTMPTWIAQAVNNTAGVAAGPVQFDLLWSAVSHQTAAIYQQATGWENLGYRIETWVVKGLIGLVLLVAFLIYELSRAVMGLIVAAVPFLLALGLFDASKAILMRAIDKVVTILILQLLLAIMLQIMLAADVQIMTAQVADPAAGLDEQIDGLWSILLVFAFGGGAVLIIPTIAAHIGGGIDIAGGVRALGAGLGMAARGARGVAGAAGRAGGRGVQAARAKLGSQGGRPAQWGNKP